MTEEGYHLNYLTDSFKAMGPVLSSLLLVICFTPQASWEMDAINIQLRRIPGKRTLHIICHMHDYNWS